MIKLNDAEKERLVNAWIALCETEEGSSTYEEKFWAYEQLSDLRMNDSELCWEIIINIMERDISDKVLANLGAGPLENLLAIHGATFIERVEALSRQDPKFRKLLGIVWQNLTPDDIWERVKAVAGESW